MAIVNSALACRQTGWGGWVIAASCRAHSATNSGAWLAPKMPKGLIRIIATLGLAVWIGMTPQAAGDCHAAIEGPGVQSKDVGFSGFIGIMPSLIRQQAGQQKDHFRIVRRLTGDGVPCATVRKITDAIRVFPLDVLLIKKLDQAAKGVSVS